MQVKDQFHALANLPPIPIGKAHSPVRRCDEKVNVSVCLSQMGKVESFIYFLLKIKIKPKVRVG